MAKFSILDYNKSLTQYKKTGNIAPVNQAVSQIQKQYSQNTAPRVQFNNAGVQIPQGQSLGVQPQASSYQAPSNPPSNYLENIPDQPSFDETPFNDLIGQIDNLGGVFRSDYDTAQKGIEARSTSELGVLEQNKVEGEQNLQQYKTQAEQDAESNINEQRQQQSEVQQGILARYGGRNGIGAFVSELASRDTLKNIAGFRQALSNEFSKVNQLQSNLLKTYTSERQKITSQTEQLLAEAKNQLSKQLTDLQIRKGEVNAEKSSRRTQSLENYQSVVRDINARNTQYLRDLDAQKGQIQNSLQSQAYKMQYNAMQKALSFYDAQAARGGLTETGMRSAEQAYGIPAGSLQAPTGILNTKDKKKDKNNQPGYTPPPIDYTNSSFYEEEE